MSNDEYFKKVNEYFNNLKKCDLKYKHKKEECCYTGSIGERWAKYQEFEKEGIEKRAKEKREFDELPLNPPKLIRSKPIYIKKKKKT